MTEGATLSRHTTLRFDGQGRLGRFILYRSIARAVWRQDGKLGTILLQAHAAARSLLQVDADTG
eukprot:7217770-Pyramimonas_sp.AAC.1